MAVLLSRRLCCLSSDTVCTCALGQKSRGRVVADSYRVLMSAPTVNQAELEGAQNGGEGGKSLVSVCISPSLLMETDS